MKKISIASYSLALLLVIGTMIATQIETIFPSDKLSLKTEDIPFMVFLIIAMLLGIKGGLKRLQDRTFYLHDYIAKPTGKAGEFLLVALLSVTLIYMVLTATVILASPYPTFKAIDFYRHPTTSIIFIVATLEAYLSLFRSENESSSRFIQPFLALLRRYWLLIVGVMTVSTLLFNSIFYVPQGHMAIVMPKFLDGRSLKDQILRPGIHLKVPLYSKLYLFKPFSRLAYDLSTQSYDYNIEHYYSLRGLAIVGFYSAALADHSRLRYLIQARVWAAIKKSEKFNKKVDSTLIESIYREEFSRMFGITPKEVNQSVHLEIKLKKMPRKQGYTK